MKRFMVVFTVLIVLAFSGCGSNSLNTTSNDTSSIDLANTEESEVFDLDEFIALVSACNDDIMDMGVLLSNMGTYEYNYWKALNDISGNIDYDSMVSMASDWLNENANENIDTLKESYEKICKQYEEIVVMDITGPEAGETKMIFKELFDYFNSLYLLVTSPSGDISTFSSNFNTYVNGMTTSNSELEIFLND